MSCVTGLKAHYIGIILFILHNWRATSKQLWPCFCLVTKSCLTLCDAMDCSPPGSSSHGISQPRILVWVALPPPRDLPNPVIKPTSLASLVSANRFFSTAPLGKPNLAPGRMQLLLREQWGAITRSSPPAGVTWKKALKPRSYQSWLCVLSYWSFTFFFLCVHVHRDIDNIYRYRYVNRYI